VGGHESVESGVYFGWAGVGVEGGLNREGEEGKGREEEDEEEMGGVWPMVMSIGWNPFYGNTVRSVVSPFPPAPYWSTSSFDIKFPVRKTSRTRISKPATHSTLTPRTPHHQEVHILHTFPQDFYGARMNLLILGFIRPEYDYVSKESLIEDIRVDIEVARRSLERETYAKFKNDGYLVEFGGEGHDNEVAS